jgi:hypothetical protein
VLNDPLERRACGNQTMSGTGLSVTPAHEEARLYGPHPPPGVEVAGVRGTHGCCRGHPPGRRARPARPTSAFATMDGTARTSLALSTIHLPRKWLAPECSYAYRKGLARTALP